MLLVDHFLRGTGALGQFFEFFGQFGFRGEQRCAVGCAVSDVYLTYVQMWLFGIWEKR